MSRKRGTFASKGGELMQKDQEIQKWGFGMAPLKPKTEYSYKKSVYSLYKILVDSFENGEMNIEDISVFKGLVNRCIKQDQWDWFTVFSRFGEPDPNQLESIPNLLVALRKSLLSSDKNESERIREKLINVGTLDLCETFLQSKASLNIEGNNGFIYILSKREEPEILKIGMTHRSVEQRVKEINSATGVLFPYSARGVFKVINPSEAEKAIFDELARYRIRKDREFFKIEYRHAMKIIKELLHKKGFLQI